MNSLTIVFLVGLVAVSYAADNTWSGSWSDESNGRLGGVFYTCERGSRVHGVFSKAGWIRGAVNGYRATGSWYMAGDPFDDRDKMYGTFDISLLDDNSGFRGEYYYGDREGRAHPWAETRLPSPYPFCPDDTLCLVPDDSDSATITGHFYGGDPATDLFLCREFQPGKESDRIYGSLVNPDFSGSVEGFTPDASTSFHGFYYTEDRAGGFFLRAVSNTWIRGFRWPAIPNRGLLNEVKEQIFQLKTRRVSNFQCNCNEVFTPSSANKVSFGMVAVVALLSALF